jgi:ATP-dependent Clp protease ATP-binding subunit ClpC
MINPPSVEETIEILKGLKERYEMHHNVKISDEAIESAAILSDRYITERFLPDKAIDLIDEAASRHRLQLYNPPEEIEKVTKAIKNITEEKEEAIKKQDYEKAAALRDSERSLKIGWITSNKLGKTYSG